jgi:hypothetical protein
MYLTKTRFYEKRNNTIMIASYTWSDTISSSPIRIVTFLLVASHIKIVEIECGNKMNLFRSTIPFTFNNLRGMMSFYSNLITTKMRHDDDNNNNKKLLAIIPTFLIQLSMNIGTNYVTAMVTQILRIILLRLRPLQSIRIHYEERIASKHQQKMDRKNVKHSYRSSDSVTEDSSSIRRTIRQIANDSERHISLSHDEFRRILYRYQQDTPTTRVNDHTVLISSLTSESSMTTQRNDNIKTSISRTTHVGPTHTKLHNKIESVRLSRDK